MGKLVLPIVLGVIGVVVVAGISILGWVVIPNVIDSQIEEQVRIVEDTDTYEKWQKNPVPVYFDVYVWHVNNPKEVENFQAIPDLSERGPFRYEEFREKVDIVHNSNNDSYTYKEKITYVYRQSMSWGNSPDTLKQFNVVNAPFLIVSNVVYIDMRPLANLVVSLLNLFGEKLVRTNVSVRDMMFDGMQLHSLYGALLSLVGVPTEFTDNRFAFYRMKNGTPEDTFEVKSGVQDSQDFGKILRYNEFHGKVNYWSIPEWMKNNTDPALVEKRNSYCNQINGTDGSIFAPFVKKENILPIFVSDICRSIYLTFKEETEFRDIPGYRFTFPDAFFEDPVINGDNYCFCTSPRGGLNDSCAAGVIRIFPCKNDAPIVTSSPHFLHSDPRFAEYVTGMSPVEEKHATFIDVEPNTGHMLRIDKKLQISMELQPLEVDYFKKHVKKHYLFPAFWVNEHTQIDEVLRDDLFSRLLTPLKIIDIAKWTVLGVGIILVVAAGVVFFARR